MCIVVSIVTLEETQIFFKQLLGSIGEDPDRQGLIKTPERFLKSFQELTQGYLQNLEEIVNDALFDCESNQPVYIQDIPFYSLCEHHLLPFFGKCQVAYIPNGKVLGLSKIYRIVDLFAKRLQLQERLTQQIGDALKKVTNAKALFVELTGEHLCVAMRGVQRNHSFTHTVYRYGEIPAQPANLNTKKVIEPTTTLHLCTLELPLKIGCYESEQHTTTPVKIEIDVQLPMEMHSLTDQLNCVICYDQLIQFLEKTCFKERYQLIEYACRVIYEQVHHFLEKMNKDCLIRVSLKKILQHPLLADSTCCISDF